VSEQQPPPQAPLPRPAFITEREWTTLSLADQGEWAQFCKNVAWLMDQPQFRNVMFRFLNDEHFCGTDTSPVRATTELTFRAIGVQDAGRAQRLVLQSVSPRMWMRLMHDAFNGAGAPRGAKE
jgi:hypothetical protein